MVADDRTAMLIQLIAAIAGHEEARDGAAELKEKVLANRRCANTSARYAVGSAGHVDWHAPAK
jgi:hypothetical protein